MPALHGSHTCAVRLGEVDRAVTRKREQAIDPAALLAGDERCGQQHKDDHDGNDADEPRSRDA